MVVLHLGWRELSYSKEEYILQFGVRSLIRYTLLWGIYFEEG